MKLPFIALRLILVIYGAYIMFWPLVQLFSWEIVLLYVATAAIVKVLSSLSKGGVWSEVLEVDREQSIMSYFV